MLFSHPSFLSTSSQASKIQRRLPRCVASAHGAGTSSLQRSPSLRRSSSTSQSSLTQQARKILVYEKERDQAMELAQTCSGRSKRLQARIRSLERYAQERLEAGDEESARRTVQTKLQVQGVLNATLARAQNNFRFAARLQDLINIMQLELSEVYGVEGWREALPAGGDTSLPPLSTQEQAEEEGSRGHQARLLLLPPPPGSILDSPWDSHADLGSQDGGRKLLEDGSTSSSNGDGELEAMAQALGQSMDGGADSHSDQGMGDDSSGEHQEADNEGRGPDHTRASQPQGPGVQLILHRESSRGAIDLGGIDWQQLRDIVEQAAQDDSPSDPKLVQKSLDDALQQLRRLVQGS